MSRSSLLVLFIAAYLAATSVLSAKIDPRCKVRSVRTGTMIVCKPIEEYEEYEYESSMRTIKTCVRFTVDGGVLNPRFKTGDNVDNYKGKFWCPTIVDYNPTKKTGLDWGVCTPNLPAVCFPPATMAPVNRPTAPTNPEDTRAPTFPLPTVRPTTASPTQPTRKPTKTPTQRPTKPTKSPTFAPTTLSPTFQPTTLTPTMEPTSKSPTAKPTRPTKRPTPPKKTSAPTKYPAKRTPRPTLYPTTKQPSPFPTKRPTWFVPE